MAKIKEINETEWKEWIESRPLIIQEMAKKVKPSHLYKLKSTGQRVTPYSYSEKGTVNVFVSGKYNMVTFERLVYGINPDDLEECEIPSASECVGTVFKNKKDIGLHIKFIRKEPVFINKNDWKWCYGTDLEKRGSL